MSITVEHVMNRRARDRRNEPDQAVGVALGLVIIESTEQRASDRRQRNRRRGDARSVAETLESMADGATVMTFTLGARERRSAVFDCGCVAVDPSVARGAVQLLECPTHAALQAKLRRRQTDRH